MMRSRLTTGFAAGALFALAPASLAQFSANDFMESAGTYEAPVQELAQTDPGATFAADVAPEPFSAGGDEQAQGRPMIGVLLEDKDGAPVVQAVIAGGPAEAAGLKAGDVLVSVGDRFTGDLETLRSALAGLAIGDSVYVGVNRDGGTMLMTLTLADSETLDLPDGPEDLEIEDEEIVEEEIADDNEWAEEEIELEIAELEDITFVDGEWLELEDFMIEEGEVVVLEDVTHGVQDGESQVLRFRTVGPGGQERVEVIELEDGTHAIFGDVHGEHGEHGLELRRNVAVPMEPEAPAGACCDCDCSCTQGASALKKNVQVWTSQGPDGQLRRQASKQVDVSSEVARALKESGLDDARIAEVLETLEAHQLDGELSFGLMVSGAGVAEPKVFPKGVQSGAPKVTYGWTREAPHASHEGEHGHEHGGEQEHGIEVREHDVHFGLTTEAPHAHDGEADARLRWVVKGSNAAAAPSSGYFFDMDGRDVEVEVEHLHEAHEAHELHGLTDQHPLVQRYRIQKPKRPSTDGAEEELERLRSELQALRQEIRDLRSAIRARGR